ncbi:MAG: hypothetical protein OXH70_01595 [Acidobacteria bacterium]|nr:hypothetical protein [Acidobacteriota bacterium]
MVPRVEPDEMWMEKRLGEILRRVVGALLEQGGERPSAEVLGSFQIWIAEAAYRLNTDQLELGLKIVDEHFDSRDWASPEAHERAERDRFDRLALLDCVAANIPDTAGALNRRLATLCSEAMTALEDIDAATFEQVYKALVPAAFRAQDRVVEELAEAAADSTLLASSDLMMELLEISGYAYLWKFALGEDRFWDCVTTVWDEELSSPAGSVKSIFLSIFGEIFRAGVPGLSPRGEIRWQWKARARHVLEERGFAPRTLVSQGDATIVALDPLSDYCVRNWDMANARDLMLSEYILNRPEAEGLQMPRNVKDLRSGAGRLLKRRAQDTARVW